MIVCFLAKVFSRATLPSLDKEGWLRPLIKCREASLAGADGVVGSSHRLSEVERTTPSAPFKEREYLLMVRPPLLIQGGEFRLRAILTFFLLCFSCSKQPANLTQIQLQHSGDYTVTLLNDTGVVKQHSKKLTLEFRNTSTNELAKVSNVQVQASMRMPGMGPMFGTMSSTREIGPGRYEFDADFSMAGQWNFLVTFDPMGRVQFNLNAQ
jgi:hypothetical protein